MKANELTLGDHVQVNGEVFKVISISYFDIGISDNKKDFYHEHIDNIKPIPLTTEILKKNGFNETFWGGEWTNNKVDFILIEHSDGFRVIDTNIVLSGIHQLQHALRLCGIDKEIEL